MILPILQKIAIAIYTSSLKPLIHLLFLTRFIVTFSNLIFLSLSSILSSWIFGYPSSKIHFMFWKIKFRLNPSILIYIFIDHLLNTLYFSLGLLFDSIYHLFSILASNSHPFPIWFIYLSAGFFIKSYEKFVTFTTLSFWSLICISCFILEFQRFFSLNSVELLFDLGLLV